MYSLFPWVFNTEPLHIHHLNISTSTNLQGIKAFAGWLSLLCGYCFASGLQWTNLDEAFLPRESHPISISTQKEVQLQTISVILEGSESGREAPDSVPISMLFQVSVSLQCNYKTPISGQFHKLTVWSRWPAACYRLPAFFSPHCPGSDTASVDYIPSFPPPRLIAIPGLHHVFIFHGLFLWGLVSGVPSIF